MACSSIGALYSIFGRGEWVMHNEKIAVPEYEPLVQQFNPVKFNADEWVSIAADAGQRYMVITSRHHDGFSMYDTALSDYKVTRTPFKRDPLHELADACARRSDVKLGFYNSLLDWHHPAYRFREESGLAWEDYIGFLHGQVRELCTQFGEIACIWFDGDWPNHLIDSSNAYFAAGGAFEYEKLYEMIHTLQPDAVVRTIATPNRCRARMCRASSRICRARTPPVSTPQPSSTLPMEVCMTINDNWGVNAQDENHKSSAALNSDSGQSRQRRRQLSAQCRPDRARRNPAGPCRTAAGGGWMAACEWRLCVRYSCRAHSACRRWDKRQHLQ